MSAVDPLEGVDLDGAFALKLQGDRPDLSLLKGDLVIARRADDAAPGRMVVVKGIADKAAVRRWDPAEGHDLAGAVVCVVRKGDL